MKSYTVGCSSGHSSGCDRSCGGCSDLQRHWQVTGVHNISRGNGRAEKFGSDFADFSGIFRRFLLRSGRKNICNCWPRRNWNPLGRCRLLIYGGQGQI